MYFKVVYLSKKVVVVQSAVQHATSRFSSSRLVFIFTAKASQQKKKIRKQAIVKQVFRTECETSLKSLRLRKLLD